MFDRITMVGERGYDLSKYPRFEAIYMITSCETSIEQIKKDFSLSDNSCPPMLLKELMEHPAQRFIKTVKEVNLGFVPYEPQVLSLDYRGLTNSEMRSVYEVNADLKNCEVLVGDTHFLTPEGFIDDLKNFTQKQSDTSL